MCPRFLEVDNAQCPGTQRPRRPSRLPRFPPSRQPRELGRCQRCGPALAPRLRAATASLEAAFCAGLTRWVSGSIMVASSSADARAQSGSGRPQALLGLRVPRPRGSSGRDPGGPRSAGPSSPAPGPGRRALWRPSRRGSPLALGPGQQVFDRDRCLVLGRLPKDLQQLRVQRALVARCSVAKSAGYLVRYVLDREVDGHSGGSSLVLGRNPCSTILARSAAVRPPCRTSTFVAGPHSRRCRADRLGGPPGECFRRTREGRSGHLVLHSPAPARRDSGTRPSAGSRVVEHRVRRLRGRLVDGCGHVHPYDPPRHATARLCGRPVTGHHRRGQYPRAHDPAGWVSDQALRGRGRRRRLLLSARDSRRWPIDRWSSSG